MRANAAALRALCRRFVPGICILQTGERKRVSPHVTYSFFPLLCEQNLEFLSTMITTLHPATSTCVTLNWRAFENISSNSEAASAAACCVFSLSTLEVASADDDASFALTERRQPEVWRWAVIGSGGIILEEGYEASQCDAKVAALEALNLMIA